LHSPDASIQTSQGRFLDRYTASIGLTSEQLNDATWAGQFMSPDDHARADYLAALLTVRGVPVEHRDPMHPPPLWRVGAVVSTTLLDLAQKEGFDWTTNLRSFGHRVLFLRGELNEAATLQQQQELAASYADAEVVTIAGAGHEVIWERPAEYLAHTRAYFATIGFSGGGQ
jgi:proline iminopeptidase